MANPKETNNFQSLYDGCSALEIPELLDMVQKLQTHLIQRLKTERSTHLEVIEKGNQQLEKERKEWEALAQKF